MKCADIPGGQLRQGRQPPGNSTLHGVVFENFVSWGSPPNRRCAASGIDEILRHPRNRVETVHHDVSLGCIDAHGHIEAAVVKLLVEHFRIAM